MSSNPTGAQAALPFDVCAAKHQGNPQSKAANLRAEPHKKTLRQRIYARLVLAGLYGATCKELAAAEGRAMHAVSGRISELKQQGHIQESSKVRDRGRVLVVAYLVKPGVPA